MLALGVDVSARRGLDVVAVDAVGRVVGPTPVAGADALTLERLLRELRPDAVAIDGPPSWGTPPHRSRAAEIALRRLGIVAYSTPSDPAAFANPFYAWMRAAHAAFAAAAAAGYAMFRPGRPVAGTALEVFPHASAVALAGCLPPTGWSRTAASKRRWRADVLVSVGVDVERLRTLDAVDAALAAVTARSALAGDFFALGDEDAVVVLPGCRPPGAYDRRPLT